MDVFTLLGLETQKALQKVLKHCPRMSMQKPLPSIVWNRLPHKFTEPQNAGYSTLNLCAFKSFSSQTRSQRARKMHLCSYVYVHGFVTKCESVYIGALMQ